MTPTHEGEVCEAEEPVFGPQPRDAEPTASPTPAPSSVDRMVTSVAGPPMKERSMLEHYTPLRFTWPGGLDFEAEIGGQRERLVDVSNDDGVPRTVHSVYVTGSSAFTISKSPTVILARSSARIAVAYTPRTNTLEHGTLFIAPEHGVGAAMPLVGRPTQRDTKPAPAPTPPARPLEAPQSKAGGELLSPAPSSVDFGEQVTGSHETRRVGAPFNLTQQPAIATFQVSGTGFALLSAKTLTLSPSAQMNMSNWEHNSPLIEFSPEHGKQKGKLTMTVVWGDGTTRTQVIELVGRGRLRTEAPTPDEPTAQEVAAQRAKEKRVADERAAEERTIAKDQKREDPYPRNHENELDDVQKGAESAAMGLADAQKLALDTLDKDAREYTKKKNPPPVAFWKTLLEISLSLATAGIASHVAKNLLPALLSRLAGQDGAAKLSEFTTEVVKDGLKTAGKNAIKSAFSGSGGDSQRTDDKAPDDDASSPNAMNEFFRRQMKAHLDHKAGNVELVRDRVRAVRPLLRTAPARAVAVIDTLRANFEQEKQFAEVEQARTLAAQWATSVAKRSLGTEKVGDAEATKLDAARELTKEQMPSPRGGLLDIRLERHNAMPRVVSARMTGVSAEIATRLLRQPLKNYPMPVRFVLDANDAKPTIITRDEVGRVRIAGDAMYFSRFSSNSLDRKDAAHRLAMKGEEVPEAEGIAGATFVVEHILSSPLVAWGVDRIEHDDASGLGNR